jgi:hypothetical protein
MQKEKVLKPLRRGGWVGEVVEEEVAKEVERGRSNHHKQNPPGK